MSETPKKPMPKMKETKSAADIAREQAEERKENLIAIVLVVLFLVGIAVWVYVARFASPAVDPDERVPLILAGSAEIGNANAPVVVVEFSDFECPYCGVFARESKPAIITQLIESGKVRFVYKHFPLQQIHPRAQRAAQAAVCANDQGVFWEYHDALYENQDALEIGNLLAYAGGIVPDTQRFKECVINDETYAQVIREKQQGIDAGVTGTPTFFFNGRRVTGAMSAEQFAAEVEKELVIE